MASGTSPISKKRQSALFRRSRSPGFAQGAEDAVDSDGVADSMRVSIELDRESQHRARFAHLIDQDGAPEPKARNRSWPAGPRRQPYDVLKQRIESLQRRITRIDAKREEALNIRSQLKFLRGNYRQQHVWVDESQRTLNDHIEQMIQSDDFVTTRDDLIVFYGRARADYLGLEDQSLKLQALEDKLAQVEAKIKNQEAHLSQSSERVLGLLRHLNPSMQGHDREYEMAFPQGAPTEQFSTDEDADQASSRESSVNTVLEEYFDKAGNIGVETDRLMELMKDHEQLRIHRNLLEDQGEKPEMTDSEFNLMCISEREAADEAVRAAIAQRDEWRVKCLEIGINPDDYRHETRQHIITAETGGTGAAVEVDKTQPELPLLTDKVKQWINSIEQEHIEHLMDTVSAEESAQVVTSPPPRRDLEEYLAQHVTAESIARLATLGIDVPSATTEEIQQFAAQTGSTFSDRSRTSSDTHLPTLAKMKMGVPYTQLIAGLRSTRV